MAFLTKAEEKCNPGARRALGLDVDTVYVSTSAQPLYMVFESEVCIEGWKEGVVILPVPYKALHLPHGINQMMGSQNVLHILLATRQMSIFLTGNTVVRAHVPSMLVPMMHT